MKTKKSIKLPFTDFEKQNLKKGKVKISEILSYSVDELEVLLNASSDRAREIFALAEFQTVPSIGVKFAEDLVFMDYYSLDELKDKNGATLTDEYEQKKGFRTDPCVEDQFRLAVHYANHKDLTKTWWNFTEERKKFRHENGYPENRPIKAWHETLKSTKTIIINADNFSDLAGFYEEMNSLFMKNVDWKLGRSLDALNDILYGGFGVFNSDEQVIVLWNNFSKSKKDLGFEETIRNYQMKINQGYPYNVTLFQEKLAELKNGNGQTLCDIIIEIFEDHKNIELKLND